MNPCFSTSCIKKLLTRIPLFNRRIYLTGIAVFLKLVFIILDLNTLSTEYMSSLQFILLL